MFAGLQGSTSTSYTQPRLTYPQDTQDAAVGLHAEESESDILPFAIDGDAGAFDAASPPANEAAGRLLLSCNHRTVHFALTMIFIALQCASRKQLLLLLAMTYTIMHEQVLFVVDKL